MSPTKSPATKSHDGSHITTIPTPPAPAATIPEFSRLVKELRQRAGMSQGQLADAAQMSSGYIGLIETGRRGERPGLDKVKAIAQALGANLDEMEQLLRAAGHLSEHERLLPVDRKTFAEMVASFAELTKDQKMILTAMFRSWTGHD